MLQWIYNHIVFDMPYKLDIPVLVATITPNKPAKYRTKENADDLEYLRMHLSEQGYNVFVRQ